MWFCDKCAGIYIFCFDIFWVTNIPIPFPLFWLNLFRTPFFRNFFCPAELRCYSHSRQLPPSTIYFFFSPFFFLFIFIFFPMMVILKIYTPVCSGTCRITKEIITLRTSSAVSSATSRLTAKDDFCYTNSGFIRQPTHCNVSTVDTIQWTVRIWRTI